MTISASLVQYYGDCPVIDSSLIQYYGDARIISSTLLQKYGDAYQIMATLEQPYSLTPVLLAVLEQKYSIAGAEVLSVCEQIYNLAAYDSVLTELSQPYSIFSGDIATKHYDSSVVSVVVGGVAVGYSHINIEFGVDQYCISFEVRLGSLTDYVACRIMDEVIITIDGVAYLLFIEGKSRTRKHGSAQYTIKGLSPSAKLDKPYAALVNGELTGMASAIVSELAAGYSVNWQTVDWFIPPGVLTPADQSPLDIIRQIAAAAGAIVQTEPDGTITIEPYYPVSLPDWDSCTPDYFLSDARNFLTTGETFAHRDGYNRYLVGDQVTGSENFTPEEEELDEYRKYIKAYKVPWDADFSIRHTGGDWVDIEVVGIEEKLIDGEIVEFVGGEGKTSKPVYGISAVEWLTTSLGAVAYGEDGTLSADVAAESLLKISYTTRFKKFLVTDNRSEKLQLVAEDAL